MLIRAEGPGFLVLADTYYPGWQVFVDGVENRVYQADSVLRAVPLGMGPHRVEFVYDPASFKAGLLITTVVLLSLGITAALALTRIVRSGGPRRYEVIGKQ